jgi:hypothetical protein
MSFVSNDLAFVDVETVGLDMEHDIWEVAIAIGDGEIAVFQVPHSLQNANPKALEINGYRSRINRLGINPSIDIYLANLLEGMTLVGANPSFDAYRLQRRWGRQPWHYRMIDVEAMAVPIFKLVRPLGLHNLVNELKNRGFDIPENNHTAAGDVNTTREVYKALMTWEVA